MCPRMTSRLNVSWYEFDSKARHGKDRIGEDQKKGPWLMLGSNGKGPDWDPYAARLEEKNKAKEKQSKQEQRNVDEQNQSG